MLKIIKDPQWTHEVIVSVPVDGGFEKQSCKVTYRLADDLDHHNQDPNYTRNALEKMVVRIDDLIDDNNEILSWNERVRQSVLALPYVQLAIIKGYYASYAGGKLGNLEAQGLPG